MALGQVAGAVGRAVVDDDHLLLEVERGDRSSTSSIVRASL